MQIFCTIMIILAVSLQLSAQNITSTIIKKPSELRCNEVPARLNNIVFGAIPPNAADKPVVVYVHGWFDNGYAWFMTKNKWYENSYNAGYRTAFFFQSVSGAFEDNGKVVAAMIREACRHYNTNKVIAVCHSKGGFDMEWALYNENVWDSVQGVITLSTPYWGAPMSDLIAVPFFRTVLEAIPIVGPIFQGKGSYQMQTAYMAGVVRPMMDNHPNNRPEKFHCFAAWGSAHPTVLPNAIPDDILKVVFPDYQPLCLDIPGFGVLAGDLMSSFMGITGLLTSIAAIQPKYENPQKNHQLNDGLAPYYSALRPGSVEISERPPSPQSNLNHIDVLLSSNMWNIVQPEIEYFKNNPVLRKGNIKINNDDNIEETSLYSDVRMVQSNFLEINTKVNCKLYLIGEYKNAIIKISDKAGKLYHTIALDYTTKAMYDIFHELDLSFLEKNKNFIIESTVPITGLLRDGNTAGIYLKSDPVNNNESGTTLNVEVELNHWNENIENIKVKGFLNRNMDEKGDVIYDKLIPITFVYDEGKATFTCKDVVNLAPGIYNLSVFAEGNVFKSFATSSILVNQQKVASSNKDDLLQIYPNPAKDFVSIQFSANELNVYTIELSDIAGKKIVSKRVTNVTGIQQIQFDLKAYTLSKGTYCISLLENDIRKKGKILIIQ